MTNEYSYLEDLTFRVDLSKDPFDEEVLEALIATGVLVQVVPKQRTWKGLHTATEWIGKKIGIR